MFRTARHRLVAWNVLVLTLILAALGVAVYGTFSEQLFNAVDQELQTQQRLALERIDRTGFLYSALPGSDAQGAYRTIVTDSRGQVTFTSDCPLGQIMPPCSTTVMAATDTDALRQAALKGSNKSTTHFRGVPWRVLTFTVSTPVQVGIVQIGRSVVGEENALHELGLLLIVCILVGMLLTGFGSLFLANRAFVPIRQAFNRQRKFTADASHELRTPLALIRANAEMLGRHGDALPPGDGELIDEIIRETDHLNRLVSDLLTLARADSDSVELSARPVDFRQLVADVHEDLHLIAESHGIDSEASLDGDVVVQGDETRLRQLLLILLDNAIKYTDPGGRVEVELHREDGRARLVVSDTGIGIPAKDLPHIFDRFYRVDRAREHESGGTGLGLAIAQWIVQAHHGSIKVESEVGQGTQFQVDLPAVS